MIRNVAGPWSIERKYFHAYKGVELNWTELQFWTRVFQWSVHSARTELNWTGDCELEQLLSTHYAFQWQCSQPPNWTEIYWTAIQFADFKCEHCRWNNVFNTSQLIQCSFSGCEPFLIRHPSKKNPNLGEHLFNCIHSSQAPQQGSRRPQTPPPVLPPGQVL